MNTLPCVLRDQLKESTVGSISYDVLTSILTTYSVSESEMKYLNEHLSFYGSSKVSEVYVDSLTSDGIADLMFLFQDHIDPNMMYSILLDSGVDEVELTNGYDFFNYKASGIS